MEDNYENVQDFLKDESFVKWVNNPDSASDKIWDDWLSQNPQQIKLLQHAREFILSLRYKSAFELDTAQLEELFERIKSTEIQESKSTVLDKDK